MTLDLKTRIWWTSLRVVSLGNLLLLLGVAATTDLSPSFRLAHLALAAVYTVVCAFRSFFPRVDLERTVLVDHWLSGIVLGRSCATLAEMCFTVQLSLLLVAWSPTVPWFTPLAFALVPLIAVAQVACWAGVLTGNHLWHAVEETLWAVMVVGLAVAGVGLWPEADGGLAALLGVGWGGCLAAATVMVGIDVVRRSEFPDLVCVMVGIDVVRLSEFSMRDDRHRRGAPV